MPETDRQVCITDRQVERLSEPNRQRDRLRDKDRERAKTSERLVAVVR